MPDTKDFKFALEFSALWKRQNMICVTDPEGATGKQCECGKDAMFILEIHSVTIHICEQCIAEVGKKVIDGLT